MVLTVQVAAEHVAMVPAVEVEVGHAATVLTVQVAVEDVAMVLVVGAVSKKPSATYLAAQYLECYTHDLNLHISK